MSSDEENQTETFSPLHSSNSNKQVEVNYYDKTVLKKILNHLKKKKKKVKPKTGRNFRNKTEGRVDHQVKLKCRQLPNVAEEVKRALRIHDWNSVAILTSILCHPGVKYYSKLIYRVCFILLLTHPKTNFNLLQNFIRHITGYVLEEDVDKFIRILMFLNEETKPRGRGKYIRKTSDYKVVRDPLYENI